MAREEKITIPNTQCFHISISSVKYKYAIRSRVTEMKKIYIRSTQKVH